MNYTIISYEVINGSKYVSRPKSKPVDSIEYIDKLQKRAERLWQHVHKECQISVFVNYKCPIEKHIPWKDDRDKRRKKFTLLSEKK